MAHLITDEMLVELKAADPNVAGKVNIKGDDYLLVTCPGCNCVRLADYQCPQCNYVALKKSMLKVKAAMKQISGIADQAVLDLDSFR